MKKIITLILITFSINSFSQKNIETGYLEYKMVFPSVSSSKTEYAKLIFNDSISIFTWKRNDTKSVGLADSSSEDVTISVGSNDTIGNYVYRDFNSKKILFRNRSNRFFNAKVVKDNWIKIDWEITNEKKIINSYNCQKAVGIFRGRTYTAWFTLEIPLPYGPWKLYGLPGLIIEAYDESKEFKANLSIIKYPFALNKSDFQISLEGDNISLKEYVEFLEEIPKIRERKIMSMMGRRSRPRKSTTKTNYLEKTFECTEE